MTFADLLAEPRPLIMGVLNVTPDSFSDGGLYTNVDAAVDHAKQLIAEGADIIDVGGESTRPGSEPVSVEEELQRVLPVIERLVTGTQVIISIDTMKPEVADACLAAGAHILNDVTGLRNPDMVKVAAKHNVPVVIMHMQGTPKVMQQDPSYTDVVAEVTSYLGGQATLALEQGIPLVLLDPGIGFGKTVEHNLSLLKHLDSVVELGHPVLVGASRKSFIGKLTGAEVGDRVAGTIAAHTQAILSGAKILRVHDVKEARQAATIAAAIREAP